MSLYIVAVDLEGISCAVPQVGGSVETSRNIEYVRKQASREASAAAQALFDQGADEVIIWDNHNSGCNLDPDLLDPRVKIALGSSLYQRFPVMHEDVTGVLLVGYHAMEGTMNAVMAHTFSSTSYQWIKFNDEEIGEMAFDAASAGRHGVPVIFVSSCDKGCAEAKSFLPWAVTFATKTSLAQNRILSLHPQAAVKGIYDGVCEAVQNLARMEAYRFPEPVACEVRFKRLDQAQTANLIDMYGEPFKFKDAFTRYGMLVNHEKLFYSRHAF